MPSLFNYLVKKCEKDFPYCEENFFAFRLLRLFYKPRYELLLRVSRAEKRIRFLEHENAHYKRHINGLLSSMHSAGETVDE